MTPREKAEELVHKYDLMQTYVEGFNLDNAKQCALIAVDEILDALLVYDTRTEQYLKEQGIEYQSYELQNMDADFRYWQEVKQEIEKL